MKILWLVNIKLPEVSKLMGEVINSFGGWLVNTSIQLSNQRDIELSIAFPKSWINNIETIKGERITYYAFPTIRDIHVQMDSVNGYLTEILNLSKADIVHIFGTEFAHTLVMVNTCKKMNIKHVISIQGMVSVYAKHFMAGVPYAVQHKTNFREFVRRDNIIKQQKRFLRRGNFEIEAIKRSQNVIGRTTWDKVCTKQINDKIKYYYCNEILREEFYKHKWSIEGCEKHSIFASQASYPIKGLHFLLEGLTLIIKKYPDTKLYISGSNLTKSNTIKDKILKTSYGKYIEKLIKQYELKEHIVFTGVLEEKEMCRRYLESNVFVCPSSIENSPNSLGEAMLLGVPCVATYVGGIPDMIRHGEEGFLYQTDAPYMMAHYVCEIFKSNELANKLSNKAREHAMKTHNITCNLNTLMKIYQNIIG